MNILIITPRIPYPPFRGDKLKIYNIAKNLARNNNVHILTFHNNNKQLTDLKNFEKYGIKIETIKLTGFESIFRLILSVFSKLPFQAALFQSSKMQRKVNLLINSGDFDVAYFHWIRIAQYFDFKKIKNKTLCVIDYTDAVSLYLSRLEKVVKNPIKKIFIKIEQRRVAEHEKIAEKFHTLFICSEVDKKFLLDRGIKANIKLLYNGLDTNYFHSDISSYNRNRIIFTGNMPYYANSDAVIYFTEKIFPRILKTIPDAKFFIVGQEPTLKIRNLESKNIHVTGFVKSIREEYLKSAVNIAPMRFGAGTLNKVIESIALGVPIVGTSIALSGLPKELSKYVFVEDDEEKFADRVLSIMNNPRIREELMEEGKKVASELLSWENIVAGFESYLSNEVSKMKGKL